ncbi:hypothetical protein LguiA_023004 [Lonicera macranthoides]
MEDSSKTQESLDFDCKNNVKFREFLNLMKFSLLVGADKVFMARKSNETLFQFGSEPSTNPKSRLQNKLSQKKENLIISSNQVGDIIDCNDDYINASKVVNCPSGGYNEFPLDILTFFAVLTLKLLGFQMSVFIRFFKFPIWILYLSSMLFMFPLQTLSRIRLSVTKMALGMWISFYLRLTTFICNQFKAHKSVVNLVMRFSWGIFWSIYACLVLVGLLVLGFIIGGIVVGRLVEEPIKATETLNFDYTRASPAAFVPIMSSPAIGDFSGMMSKDGDGVDRVENVAKRGIPYNHKLLLAVSLTLPESEYNRKLGVFQVRVDFLSTNGKTTATSSHPCMLRFKSHPIRIAETVIKGVPLIAGFQSEVQVLNLKINDFTEGPDPTSYLKITLEQRAEYQSGAGIPEIYSASLELESELPQIQKIIHSWKRTIFVWISLMSFLTEFMMVMIFFRGLILPGRRECVGGPAKQVHQNKIICY